MESLQGQLLVATVDLVDPNFARSVLLMLDHGEEGATGLVLNRQTGVTLVEVAGQVFEVPIDWPKPIHLGGPVPGPLLALHGDADLSDREIMAGVHCSGSAENLLELARLRVEPSLFLANYSGWGPGQLEAEIAEGSWLTWPASSNLILVDGPVGLWEAVHRQIQAGRLARMLNLREIPSDPRLN